ncbi:MAG: tryptophan--tRNA ligase [Clostridiales Family XIII bacterium]|jgi:tryptophanyl-tRNA synthetase|nr:tryptophan--tRNA ligase [Clostridiales Family XIII bacterium]
MAKVFSGVQPTGSLHLGNYLGALKQFVNLQEENEAIYSIVDLHAITLPKEPHELKKSILDIAALFIAIGLDPKKAIIFIQSDVPAHAELAWILTCSSYTGELSRMTQFKDKAKGELSAPTGLFTYPLLMAADILLYDTNIVPVGKDQKQHIELTRNLAERINNKYGEDTFVIPQGRFLKSAAKIMDLENPKMKMSKSSKNEFSFISLLDDEKKIEKAIKRATTDSFTRVKFDEEKQKGISNLLTIYSAFSMEEIPELEKKYKNKGYGEFKKDLIEVIIENLKPIQKKFMEIRNDGDLEKILKDGGEKANEIARKTLKRVYSRFGLGV